MKQKLSSAAEANIERDNLVKAMILDDKLLTIKPTKIIPSRDTNKEAKRNLPFEI